MAVKLRLKRMGTNKKPYYRIVAADSKNPRDGKVIELIGTYNPLIVPAEVKINEELAMKWLNNGAIPTDTVRNLFKQFGLNQKFHNEKMGTKKDKPVKKVVKKAAPKKTETTEVKKPVAKKTTTKKATPKKTVKEVK